ncbi:MAG: DUF445 domain-containing protein [Pseudobacteriovorax sp.]|nr:DUF445 domain-containing protein [Pseudobacteriovorax sp.]
MNKSIVTNFTAGSLTVVGLLVPETSPYLKNIGFFALSGSITNWIAIHMLFEKIPGFYGSGIIPNKFEEFKLGIRNLMMNEFFTAANIKRFFEDSGSSNQIELSALSDVIDYEILFEKLKSGVLASPFGAMVQMFGGPETLDQLKEPVMSKMKEAINDILADPEMSHRIQEKLAEAIPVENLLEKVDHIVTARLDELTPQMVKEIIQTMIKEHLGWLVVWGGVFGGLMGFLASFFG